MAKADLLRLVKKASKQIEVSLRSTLNLKPQVFSANVDNVYAQIMHHLSQYSISSSEQDRIYKACASYTKGLYKSILTDIGNNNKINLKSIGGRDELNYTFVISNKRGVTTNMYGKIASVRLPHLKRLRERVFKILGSPSEDKIKTSILGTMITKGDRKGQTKGGLLDLGHTQAVAVYEADRAIARFSRADLAGILGADAKLTILAREANNDKIFKVTLEDESQKGNQSSASDEKAYKTKAKQAINEFIKQNQDWANQGGSRSKTDIILSELITTAKKHGGKTKAKVKSSKSPASSASSTIKATIDKPRAIPDTIEGGFGGVERSSDQNWSSLIGIINAKLAGQIVSNMQAPRLVNRTGRFAHSAIVTGVEITDQGFPSFVYDYQRDPYEVFDTAMGASPWNTPDRDPKKIISLSIREIVQELAIGRFYTRRA